MIWTIAFEAPEESDEDKAAVAYVILNRTQNGRWGDNIKDVVTHPWQFEPWMTKRQDWRGYLRTILAVAAQPRLRMLFLTERCRIPPRGRRTFSIPRWLGKGAAALPSWARSEGQPIGRHTFYKPNERSFARELAAVGVSPSCSTLEAGQTPDVG